MRGRTLDTEQRESGGETGSGERIRGQSGGGVEGEGLDEVGEYTAEC